MNKDEYIKANRQTAVKTLPSPTCDTNHSDCVWNRRTDGRTDGRNAMIAPHNTESRHWSQRINSMTTSFNVNAMNGNPFGPRVANGCAVCAQVITLMYMAWYRLVRSTKAHAHIAACGIAFWADRKTNGNSVGLVESECCDILLERKRGVKDLLCVSNP